MYDSFIDNAKISTRPHDCGQAVGFRFAVFTAWCRRGRPACRPAIGRASASSSLLCGWPSCISRLPVGRSFGHLHSRHSLGGGSLGASGTVWGVGFPSVVGIKDPPLHLWAAHAWCVSLSWCMFGWLAQAPKRLDGINPFDNLPPLIFTSGVTCLRPLLSQSGSFHFF